MREWKSEREWDVDGDSGVWRKRVTCIGLSRWWLQDYSTLTIWLLLHIDTSTILLLPSTSPVRGSLHQIFLLHLFLTSTSSSATSTNAMSSLTASIYLLLGIPCFLFPGSSILGILLPSFLRTSSLVRQYLRSYINIYSVLLFSLMVEFTTHSVCVFLQVPRTVVLR